MAEMLELESSYTIKNVDPEKPFIGKYRPGKYFVIPPGKSRGVPREYAHMWFGDPAIADPEDRYFRLTQLRCLYGIMTPSEDAAKFPRVQVYDGDNDERVLMLFEDPDGTKALQRAASGESDQVELDPQVAALRNELRDMREAFASVVKQLQHMQAGNGPEHNGPAAEAEAADKLVEPEEPIDPVTGTPVGATGVPGADVGFGADEEAALGAVIDEAGKNADAIAVTDTAPAAQDKPIRVRG